MVLPVLLAPAAAACCGACVNDIMKQPFPILDEEANGSEGEQEVNSEAFVPTSKDAPLHRTKSPLAIDMMKSFEQSKTEFRKSEYVEFGPSAGSSEGTSSTTATKENRSLSSHHVPDSFASPQAIFSHDGIEIAQNFSRGSSFPLLRIASTNSTLPESDNYHDTTTTSSATPPPPPPPPIYSKINNHDQKRIINPIVSDWGYVDGKFSDGRIHCFITKNEAQCVSFSPDTLLLAIGFESNNGLALFETRRFLSLLSISSSHTVVSIQWRNAITPTSAEVGNSTTRNYTLAIACRDGTIEVFHTRYRVNAFSRRQTGDGGSDVLLTKLYNLTLDDGARCMLFLTPCRGSTASSSLMAPAELLVGTKSGSIYIISHVPTSIEASSYLKPSINTLTCIRCCIKCIAVSSHGRLLAIGDEYGAIRIHSLSPDIPQNSLLDSRSSASVGKGVTKMSISYAHGSNDDEPLVLREGKIRSLLFSKHDEILFAGGHDNCVAMIDTTVWKVLREIRHEGAINSIVFNETYSYLAIGSRDKKLKIYDTSTFHAIKEIQTTGWVEVGIGFFF
jgi:WD40 repeat protein